MTYNKFSTIQLLVNCQLHLNKIISDTTTHKAHIPYRHGFHNSHGLMGIECRLEDLCLISKRVVSRSSSKALIMLVSTTFELGKFREFQIHLKINLFKAPVVLINQKWVSGLLTNNRTFREYVQVYKSIPLNLRTNKEQVWYIKYRHPLESWLCNEFFQLPSLIILINSSNHPIVIDESLKCGIPTVGIMSGTATHTSKRTYSLFVNNHSILSIITVSYRLRLFRTYSPNKTECSKKRK